MPTLHDLQFLCLDEKSYNELIAKKAYELWVARGCGHGGDKDDWAFAQETVDFNIAIAVPLKRLCKKNLEANSILNEIFDTKPITEEELSGLALDTLECQSAAAPRRYYAYSEPRFI